MNIYKYGLEIAVWLIMAAAVALSIQALKQKEKANTWLFLLSMAITFLWAFAYFMQLNSNQLERAFFWLSLHMIGPIVLPPVWLILVGRRSGHSHWFPPGVIALLSLIPALSLFFLHMVPWPNPMVANVEMELSFSQSLLKVTPGPWYWVHAAYSYLVIGAITLLLLGQTLRLPSPLKLRSLGLLLAFIIVIGFHIWTQSLLTEIRPNPATLVGALAFMILIIGMYRYDLLDLAPMARAQVIETMRDGVLVLDAQERLVDLNRAARETLGLKEKGLLGRHVQEALKAWPNLINPSPENMLTVHHNGISPRYYAIRRIPLSKDSKPIGQIVLLHDITESETMRQEQQRLIDDLRSTLAMLRQAHGMLPVCAWCGRVQDEERKWVSLSEWLSKHQILDLTHGMCPSCEQKLLQGLEKSEQSS